MKIIKNQENQKKHDMALNDSPESADHFAGRMDFFRRDFGE